MKRRAAFLCAVLVLLCTVTALPVSADDSALIPVSVRNGEILVPTRYECVCPLTVTVTGDGGYYVFLQYVGTPFFSAMSRKPNSGAHGSDDLGFYIAPGSTVDMNVPIGDYRLFYATGKTWYGLDDRFGSTTQYVTSDEILSFYATSSSVMGHSLELWTQVNGNLATERIPASVFPG